MRKILFPISGNGFFYALMTGSRNLIPVLLRFKSHRRAEKCAENIHFMLAGGRPLTRMIRSVIPTWRERGPEYVR